MAGATRSLMNGRILSTGDSSISGPGLCMPRAPWKLTLHLRAEIETEDGTRDHYTVHRVSRDGTGRWSVSVERAGHKPTEMSGEGDLPAIIEADGAIVILLPQPEEA